MFANDEWYEMMIKT